MKNRTRYLISLCAVLCLSGCGRNPAVQESKEQEFQKTEEVVLDESSEEFGSIESENTEEETGDVMEELSIDSEMEADHDGLIVELGMDTEGYFWEYRISDENLMILETEYQEDGKRQDYIFRAKQPGEVVISFFYVASSDEIEIPDGDNPEDYADVVCSVRIGDDLTVEMNED